MFEDVEVVEPAWVAAPETLDTPQVWDPEFELAAGDPAGPDLAGVWPAGLLDATSGPGLAPLPRRPSGPAHVVLGELPASTVGVEADEEAVLVGSDHGAVGLLAVVRCASGHHGVTIDRDG